ncbi:ATP-binding protein [Streptomyces wuyuanensis]|uniref:ATP-binding protein n=1 Tax=Streptomyces wuyuanensis TaxID=1196353 RepID=UPI0038218D1B
MSLPLTRRIARAALLVAAGAAPVVGAAGSANAVDLPTRDLGNGGLTQLDGADAGAEAGSAVDGAAREAAGTADEAGGRVVGTTLPAAAGTLGGAAETGLPAAQETAGQAAGVIGGTAGSAATQGLPAAQDLAGGGLPDAGAALPAGELPGQGHPL